MMKEATTDAIWERGMMALPASQRNAIRALRDVVRVQTIEQPEASSLEAEITAVMSAKSVKK